MVDVAKKGAGVSVIVKPLSSSDMDPSAVNQESVEDTRTNKREEDHYGFYREQEEQHN